MIEQGMPHISAGIARTITVLDAELRALVDVNTPMSLTQALRHVIRNHQVTA